jgi:sedoheptulokinase
MTYLGIDIGTSSICGVVYDSATGRTVSITRENSASFPDTDPLKAFAQDPAEIYNIALDILQNIKTKGLTIDAIGICGQMHGILYVDELGLAVSPLYTWQDTRGDKEYKDNLSYAEFLSEKTGYKVSTGYGLVTHFYNIINGLVPKGAKRICTIMDYIAMRLTDRKSPIIDPSNAASLGFFNMKELTFDTVMLESVGIKTNILPDIVRSSPLVGMYESSPVFAGIGDNQAGFIGAIKDKSRSILLSIGTSSQISVFIPEYNEVPNLEIRPLPIGGYILVGAALCGGTSFNMLMKLYKQIIEKYGGVDIPDKELYSLMEAVPYRDVSKDDILVDTKFCGTRNNPHIRGVIKNISIKNFTSENLILGFLRGISHELYCYYQAMPLSLKKSKDILVGTGNGIRKNPLLQHILGKEFDCNLIVSKQLEEAAYGACLYCKKLLTEYNQTTMSS